MRPPGLRRTADLRLVLEFVNRQQSHSELWLPLCLPRFNSSGFLHCYAHCVDAASRLTLALISQDGSTEQFQAFRTSASRIRRHLGVPVEHRKILEILKSDSDTTANSGADVVSGNDVPWRRSSADTSDAFEDDYEMIPFDIVDGGMCQLLPEIAKANSQVVERKFAEYLELGILHFVFRIDFPIQVDKKNGSKGGNHFHPGHLTQCISPPLNHSFADVESKRRVWNAYQRLQLRLRLGSANAESVHDAFRMIAEDDKQVTNLTPTIGKHCPAMGLAEAPPNMQCVTYLTQGEETFMAMNGRGFEM